MAKTMPNDEQAPNARFFDENGKAIAYEHVGIGDRLKVLYQARQGEHWLDFSPAYLHLWLNGQPLTTVRELTFTIDPQKKVPVAKIVFTLADVDIDADSLLALEAIVRGKEEGHGEESSTTD